MGGSHRHSQGWSFESAALPGSVESPLSDVYTSNWTSSFRTACPRPGSRSPRGDRPAGRGHRPSPGTRGCGGSSGRRPPVVLHELPLVEELMEQGAQDTPLGRRVRVGLVDYDLVPQAEGVPCQPIVAKSVTLEGLDGKHLHWHIEGELIDEAARPGVELHDKAGTHTPSPVRRGSCPSGVGELSGPQAAEEAGSRTPASSRSWGERTHPLRIRRSAP